MTKKQFANTLKLMNEHLSDETLRATVLSEFSELDVDDDTLEEVIVTLGEIEERDEDCLLKMAEEIILQNDATPEDILRGLKTLLDGAEKAIYFDESDLWNAYDETLGTVEIGGIEHEAARVLNDTDPIAYNLGFQDFCDAHLDEMHPCLIAEINGFYNWE